VLVLSVDRCRELLGEECPLTDEELTAVREQLYALALLAMEAAARGQAPTDADDGER
jgi:hypothetical protein